MLARTSALRQELPIRRYRESAGLDIFDEALFTGAACSVCQGGRAHFAGSVAVSFDGLLGCDGNDGFAKDRETLSSA